MSNKISPTENKVSGRTCEICSVYVPNEASWQAHLTGHKHTRNVAKQEEWKKTALSSVYVSGIKKLPIAELSLADYFSKFGSVKKITIDKTSKQYAIVELENENAVQSALENKHHVINGRSVIVKPREIKSVNAHIEAKRLKQNEKEPTLSEVMIEELLNADSIDKQFLSLQEQLQLTDDDKCLRQLLCQLLQTALHEILPDCQVIQFGSSASGLGVRGCDLDLNLQYNEVDYDAIREIHSRSDESKSLEEEKTVQASVVLSAVSEIIKQCVPDCHKVKLILTARSPVVRFYHKASKMRCDMSVLNRIAVRNTEYLQLCTRLFSGFRPLVFVVRSWMKHWELAGGLLTNGPRLNNYAATLMVLFYLQHTRKMPSLKQLRSSLTDSENLIINNCNCSFPTNIDKYITTDMTPLPELLSDFFSFYSKLDLNQIVLDLSTADIITVSDFKKLDENATGVSEMSQMKSVGSSSRPPFFKIASLNIRDPFELFHNVSGNVNDKQLKIFTKRMRNTALACKMQRYRTKRKLKGQQEWGLLNLFIDHHCKDPHDGVNGKMETDDVYKFVIEAPSSGDTEWLQKAASLILTVLRDIFLVTFSKGNFPNEINPSLHDDDEDALHSNFDNSVASDVSNEADISSSSELDFSSARKRKASDSEPCHYCKRAKLMKTTSSSFPLLSVALPYTSACEVGHRLWEGRRKARRRLVNKGKSDLLDLEREVSKLLLSDQSDSTSGTAHLSTSFNSSCSCDSLEQNLFQFNLTLQSDDSRSLHALFQPSSPSTEFSTFSRHLQIFLPNFVLKCLKT